MPDWFISLIAAFLGAFGGTLLNRYINIVDKNNLRDKETLTRLKPLFIDNGLYVYLKDHHFGEPFDIEVIRNLDRFSYYCHENPDFMFINKGLEKKRIELLKSADVFNDTLAKKSNNYGHGMHRIPNPDYDDDVDFGKFKTISDELNQLSLKVTKCYDSLMFASIKLH